MTDSVIRQASGPVVPTIIELNDRGERSFDIYSKLLNERIVFLGAPIDDVIANLVMAQLLHLEGEDPDRDIAIYINSPGGSVTSMLAVFDTMEFVKPDVSTVCIGQAASAAAVLLAAGTPGKRFALPHSRVSLHQLYGGAEGQSTDIEIAAREFERLHNVLDRILADKTSHTIERIQSDTQRHFVMTAHAARDYGVVDDVIISRTHVATRDEASTMRLAFTRRGTRDA